jgi:hypothetical protein
MKNGNEIDCSGKQHNGRNNVLGGARFALVTILVVVVVVVATGEDDDESSRGHGDDEAFFWMCEK